jgi:hypothetical protein
MRGSESKGTRRDRLYNPKDINYQSPALMNKFFYLLEMSERLASQ